MICSRLMILVLLCVPCLHGGRILGVFFAPAPSHYFLGIALMKELAKRGHDVTCITSFQSKDNIKGLKDVYLSGFYEHSKEMIKNVTTQPQVCFFTKVYQLTQFTSVLVEQTLEHENVQKLLKSDEKFDLVVMEHFMNEAHLGFAHHFDCPIVYVCPTASNPWVNQFTGNPAPSSLVPGILSGFSKKMNFMERFTNFLTGSFIEVFNELYHLRLQDEILHKHFPDAPDLKQLFKKVAFVFLNSHPSIVSPRPLLPNMVEIGGYHIPEVKPLPKDLKDYLDSSKQDFILFSLGSNFRSTNMKPQLMQDILKVFSQLPYQILWKFESPDLPGKPKNVRIEKWLPQNDILAHPNIKLFITHGGLLSTTETVYHGVPIVGIPIFGDQQMNMAMAEGIGIGKAVDITKVNEESLMGAIKEVIDNTNYLTNVRKRSALMRDQPLRPLDNAMFWIEHVLRHGGGDHFKTNALDLAWYQLYQLDVIAVLLALVFLSFYIPCRILKRCCRKSKSHKSDKNKKRN